MDLGLNVMVPLPWLTPLEWLLGVVDFTIFLWVSIPIKPLSRWVRFLPTFGAVICLINVLGGDTSSLALGFYLVSLVLFVGTIRGLFKPEYSVPPGRNRILRRILCSLGAGFLLFVALISGEIRYNPTSDLRSLSYSEAFERMNERLAAEYPFSDHKKIDWMGLKNRFLPAFKKAENEKNKDLFYESLRGYLFSLRDGHVKITNSNSEVRRKEIGGGFGISTTLLDDGRVLVNLVLKDSPADRQGIQVGAEIVVWDGQLARDKLTSTSWTDTPVATTDDQRLEQGRFMARAPIGTEVLVEYRNPDATERRSATLKAYDDNYATIAKTKATLVEGENPLESRVLGNGLGYLRIKFFLSSDAFDLRERFEETLKSFQDNNIKGLIVDLRNNPGGDDDLVTAIASHFVSEERLYEFVSYYNNNTKKFEINDSETRTISPSKLHYAGNIAILINNKTASSGEGLPLVLKGSPQVKIVGFTSTNGSFGVMTSPIKLNMPDGYVVQVPDGRSLDKNKEIQGDSDHTGRGGVAPDVRIPLNEKTFREKSINGQDVELEYAIAALNSM